mgnify:FL=1
MLFRSRDKIIIYCQSREDVGKLGDMMGCPKYTSKSGSEEEKAAIRSSWLEARKREKCHLTRVASFPTLTKTHCAGEKNSHFHFNDLEICARIGYLL